MQALKTGLIIRAKHGGGARAATAGEAEEAEWQLRLDKSRSTHFEDVPKRQSRWTVVFNGTPIKGERVLDCDFALANLKLLIILRNNICRRFFCCRRCGRGGGRCGFFRRGSRCRR